VANYWITAIVLLGVAPGQMRAQDQVFKNAFALYTSGSVEEARHMLLASERQNPSALDLSLLGTIEFQEGHLADSRTHLLSAIGREPGLAGARSTLATVFEAEGKLDRAEAQLEWLRTKSPRDTHVLLALARVRNLRGNSEAALAVALEAKRIAPADAKILYAVGVLCLQMDLIKDGATNLERAAALERNPATLYALASARVANRDLEGAVKIYQELLKSEPDNAQVNYALGATYFLESQNEAAKPYFERSVAIQPDQVESFYYLGLIADQGGDKEKSIETLRTVIARSPDHVRAHIALGMEYRSLGRLNESRIEFEEAVRLSPDSQKAHYQLGLVLNALKELGDAKKQLDMATRLRISSDDKVSWQLLPDAGHAHPTQ